MNKTIAINNISIIDFLKSKEKVEVKKIVSINKAKEKYRTYDLDSINICYRKNCKELDDDHALAFAMTRSPLHLGKTRHFTSPVSTRYLIEQDRPDFLDFGIANEPILRENSEWRLS